MANKYSTNKWIKCIKRGHKSYVLNRIDTVHGIIDGAYKKQQSYNNTDRYDSNLRIEIHDRIKKQIEEGKTILEIVQDLNSENKYKKYGMYFSTWVNDEFKKYQKRNNKPMKEDMER